jgi:hypothetical protein
MRLSKVFVDSLILHRKDFYDKAYADECCKGRIPVMKAILADVDAIIELAKYDGPDDISEHCYSDHPCDVCGAKKTRKWFEWMLCEAHVNTGNLIIHKETPCKGGECDFHCRHLSCMECSGKLIKGVFDSMCVARKMTKKAAKKSRSAVKKALRRK